VFKSVEVKLICGKKKIGTVQFDISEFISEKTQKRQFFKPFSG